MTVVDKLTTVLENVPKVYKAGQTTGYKSFWDAYTNNNNITVDCRYMFYGLYWTDKVFTPPYPIKPNPGGSYNRYMFQASGITKISTKQMDFSEAVTLRQTFALSSLEEIEMEVGNTELNATFNGVSTLEKLDLTITEETSYANSPFGGCSGLVNLTIDGTIGKSGFDLSDCTNLTLESIKSVLEACNKEQANIVVTLPRTCEGGTIDVWDACMADGNYGIEGLTTAYSNAMNALHNYTISFN